MSRNVISVSEDWKVNLIEGCDWLSEDWKCERVLGDPTQMNWMSSMYLFQVPCRMLTFFCESMAFCSSCPMNRFAYDGAQGVPMAVPRFWLYIFPWKAK